jgi:ATP-dependent DNA helicase DinG
LRVAVVSSWRDLPFPCAAPEAYRQGLEAWIGEVFYERLPAAGYEVREEQIYLAYRIAGALAEGRSLLAEGGSGTGKTFAYLLPLVCHARRHGRPAVVATATAALEEQLAGPEGDIATLSRLLGLRVDVRVAVRPEDAVCDLKVERMARSGPRDPVRRALLAWWEGSRFGARREHPEAPDAVWAEVAWDPSCRCDLCPRRGYCRLMKGRAWVREARDLVVASHALLFRDLVARRGRLAPGRLPVLPAPSAVVLDEGHRVLAEAQQASGFSLVPAALVETVEAARGQGARTRLVVAVEAARDAAVRFWEALEAATVRDPGAVRWAVRRDPELLARAATLRRLLATLEDEMALEQGLFEETPYGERLAGAQPTLDEALEVLERMADAEGTVLWREGEALWAVPRHLGGVWDGLPPGTPVVLCSATLSVAGRFDYARRVLGLRDPATARVGVPFRLAEQVLCYLPRTAPVPDGPAFWAASARHLARLLDATQGRALVLLPGPAEVAALRAAWAWPGPTLWEGDAAPARLVAAFRADVASVLVGHGFWEGVDVPGEALSAVVVPLLPVPGTDPQVAARREDAARLGLDPFTAVDVPETYLRLRQGFGRLIRTAQDRGVLAVLDGRAAVPGPLAEAVAAAWPEGARRVRTLAAVRRFLRTEGAR